MDASPRRRVLHSVAVLLVLVFAAGNRPWPDLPWWPHLWNDVWSLVVFATASLAGLQAARRAPDDDRRAWRWIAAGAAAYVLGQLAWNHAELTGYLAPFPYYSDVGFLACGVLTTIGLVRLTDVSRLRVLSGVRWDLGTLIAGLTLVVVAAAWGAFAGSDAPPFAKATAVAYVGVFVFQLAAAVALAWTPSPPEFSEARWWLVFSSTANVIGFVAWQFPLLAGAYSAGHWFDSFWIAGALFLAVAAGDYGAAYARGASTRAPAEAPSAILRVQLWSMLQVAGLLFLGLLDQLYDLPNASLVIGGGAFAAVVGLRQVYAIREERQLGEDRARLLEAATLLVRVTSDIYAGLDRESAVRRALEGARQVFGCRDILIRLGDSQGTPAETIAVWTNPDHGAAVGDARPAGLTHHCIAIRKPILITDVRDHPMVHPANVRFGVRAIAAVPLLGPTRCQGALVAYFDTERTFPPIEQTLLQAFAAGLATALENATLFAQVQEQILHLREAQAQLVQSEKLSALRQLVAGAAHELNNPLTAILGSAYLAEQRIDDAGARRYLEEIRTGAERTAQIVRSLREFAQDRRPSLQPLSVNALVERAIELSLGSVGAPARPVVRHLDPELPGTVGDVGQLEQVLLNLLANAYQAVAGRPGTVSVRTRREGGTIRIEVADDGPGVPPDVRKKIFDPFFTTRPVGEGAGLGLSVAHGIVTEHEGRIWLDETAETGARFVVELPIRGDAI